MKSIDLIRKALAISDFGMMQLIDDLRDAPFAQPTARGGNHPMWVLGHITFVEGDVPHILFGEPNSVAHWAGLFAPGAEPKNDPNVYPAFEEVRETYRRLRARNLEILEQLGEEGLDRPTQSPPPGLEDVLRTARETFQLIALHQMNHRGQLADVRRALGRKPIFTPGG